MELHEKLKILREEKGITQEELAEALFVSRTAISKWESGRGCPSIDSLKSIAKFYSVTIDELISSEAIISIAEQDISTKLDRLKNALIAIADIMGILLILLPLYPKPVDGHIYSVNLLEYVDTSLFNRNVYYVLFIALIITGAVKLTFTIIGTTKMQNALSIVSICISCVAILFLTMAREPYAASLTFLLLLVKMLAVMYKNGIRQKS